MNKLKIRWSEGTTPNAEGSRIAASAPLTNDSGGPVLLVEATACRDGQELFELVVHLDGSACVGREKVEDRALFHLRELRTALLAMDLGDAPTEEARFSRAECGPMQFGDDWPGVFIRGDSAAALSFAVRELRGHEESLPLSAKLAITQIGSYFDGGHIVGGGRAVKAQRMKGYDECVGRKLKWVQAAPAEQQLLSRMYFGLHNTLFSTVVELYSGGFVRLLEGNRGTAIIQLQQLGLHPEE